MVVRTPALVHRGDVTSVSVVPVVVAVVALLQAVSRPSAVRLSVSKVSAATLSDAAAWRGPASHNTTDSAGFQSLDERIRTTHCLLVRGLFDGTPRAWDRVLTSSGRVYQRGVGWDRDLVSLGALATTSERDDSPAAHPPGVCFGRVRALRTASFRSFVFICSRWCLATDRSLAVRWMESGTVL